MVRTIRGCALVVGLLGVIAQAACTATVTHRPVPDDQVDRTLNGIRYYQSSLYLIAWSDGKGGLTTMVKALPDPNKKMVALPRADGAKLDLTMKFTDGVLTQSTSTADASEVPKTVVSAIEKLVPLLLAAGYASEHAQEGKQAGVPAPYIFKIITRGPNIEFRGSQGQAPIIVNVPRKTGESHASGDVLHGGPNP